MQSAIQFTKSKALLTAVFLVLLAATSVAVHTGAYAAAKGAQGKKFTVKNPDYIIGPEDILDISVWKNADLSKIVTVRPDGKISLPLIGDLQAAGLTPQTLRHVITNKLRQYQDSAVVSVIVQTVNSYRIFILGQVTAPGTYLLKSKTTILQAISLAGGFTQYASKNSMILIRRKTDGSGNKKIKVRLKDLLNPPGNSRGFFSHRKKLDKNLVLKPGDTIFVP